MIRMMLIAIMLCAGVARAQGPELLDLSKLEPQQQFDFLLGNWSYKFEQGHGETSCRKTADGAIEESLEPAFYAGRPFSATAYYLYSAKNKYWKQHWVDTLGNVIQLTITLQPYAESKLPALVGVFEQGATHFKHLWYNISAASFDTDLFVSSDGVDYQLVRRMPYLRKQAAPN